MHELGKKNGDQYSWCYYVNEVTSALWQQFTYNSQSTPTTLKLRSHLLLTYTSGCIITNWN